MLLKTTLIRDGGSTHEIDGVTYHFGGPGDGPHVCEVASQAHVKRFLGIDGFEIADEPVPVPTPAAPMIQMDRDNRAAAAAAALAALPVTNTAPIAPPVQPAASILDGTDAVAESLPAPDFNAMDDAAIDAAFVERFGKPPHPRAKRASIIRTLQNADQPKPAEG